MDDALTGAQRCESCTQRCVQRDVRWRLCWFAVWYPTACCGESSWQVWCRNTKEHPRHHKPLKRGCKRLFNTTI